jgi:endosialidase-like protein
MNNRERKNTQSMYPLNQLKTIVSCGRDPARSLPLRRGFLLIPLILVCFALSPQTQAEPLTPDPGSVPFPNTADGTLALSSVTSGIHDSAFGFWSQRFTTTARFCTGVGAGTLFINNADENTAVGAGALLSNTSGVNNTACGTFALFTNAGTGAIGTGSFNNAVGANSLLFNVDGDSNNALGESALFNNISAAGNTAIGDVALANNDSDGAALGNSNTAVGAGALFSNVDGDSNNAVGFNSLGSNSDGLFNNVVGFDAMADNVHGAGNVAVGDSAGLGVEGDFNIYIGAFAGPAPSPSPVPESETIRIGDVFNTGCFIGGIFGVTTGLPDALPVVVDSNGQMGTVVSSARFKDNIKPMDKSSEAILSLKPVTFHYKKDKSAKPQFGLVAEEVAAVNPDLVVRDRNGEILTVRYEAVNAMLLNEFLKEHRTVQDLKSTVARQEELIAKQQEGMAVLTAQLKEQGAQIQRVSAQLEVNKPAPQVVENR